MKAFGQIMKIGLPAGIQSAVFAVSNIVIQSAINTALERWSWRLQVRHTILRYLLMML